MARENKKKLGTITIPTDVFPHRHELETASFLAGIGNNVAFIAPSRMKGAKSPDIHVDGVDWEIKRPRANGKFTIEHAFRAALRQSENIIFDLRSHKAPEHKTLVKLSNEFQRVTRVRRLQIIAKSGRHLDLRK